MNKIQTNSNPEYNFPSVNIALNQEKIIEYFKSSKPKELHLTCDKIVEWYETLTQKKEKSSLGLHLKLSPYVEKINQTLKELQTDFHLGKLATLIGTSTYELEKMEPFQTNNREMAQLMASYLSSYAGLPPIQFKNNEQLKYQDHLASAEEMIQLVSQKMRESVFDAMGNQYFLEKSFSNSGLYRHPETNETLIVEWHEYSES